MPRYQYIHGHGVGAADCHILVFADKSEVTVQKGSTRTFTAEVGETVEIYEVERAGMRRKFVSTMVLAEPADESLW